MKNKVTETPSPNALEERNATSCSHAGDVIKLHRSTSAQPRSNDLACMTGTTNDASTYLMALTVIGCRVWVALKISNPGKTVWLQRIAANLD